MAAGKARRGRRREAGFTVMEMLVAFVILLIATALAAQLLKDVGMQVAWSGRKAVEISPNLALEQIRTDLRGSSGTPAAFGTWVSAPLAITGSSTGYQIVYLIEAGNLLRRTIDPAGKEQNRLVLDNVVDLRYRDKDGAVEIEVEFLRMKPPLRRDTAAGMREEIEHDHRRMAILVSPRRIEKGAF